MNTLSRMLVPLLLSSLAVAQSPTETSPAGFVAAPSGCAALPEGFLSINGECGAVAFGQVSFFGQGLPVSHQRFQLDDTLLGTPRTIQALHLRQLPESVAGGSQGVQIAVRMAHGDSTLVTPGVTQAADSVTSTPWVDVVAPRTVVIPDQSTQAPTGVTPWSVRIPLDQSFAYDGVQSLVVHTSIWSPSASDFLYRFDAVTATQRLPSAVVASTACTVDGDPYRLETLWTIPADPTANASIEFLVSVDRGIGEPSIGPVPPVIVLGNQLTSLDLGACSPLRVEPMASFLMPNLLVGQAPPGRPFESFEVPISTQMVGFELHAQALRLRGVFGAPNPEIIASDLVRTRPFPDLSSPLAVFGSEDIIGPDNGAFVDNVELSAGSAMLLGIE